MTKKKTPPTDGTGSILVPVDFSPVSGHVVTHANELAEATGRGLAILHVVHDPGEAPGYYRVKGRNKMLRRAEDVAGEMLQEFVADCRKRHPDSKPLQAARSVLVVGLPVTRILEVAKRLEAWSVVMGSAGRTGLSRFLLGSKAEQVLRLCPLPVTIVKVPLEVEDDG